MTVGGYDDPCWLARALDRVGEPWALLVVRELAYGPKRFSDLRRGLGGASHPVLAQRLAELESSGVIQQCRLPPPVSASAYELTALGHDLLPSLVALARWGSQLPLTARRAMGIDAFWLSLQAAYVPGRAGTGRLLVQLTDTKPIETTIEARHDDSALHWSYAVMGAVDATVRADLATLQHAIFGRSGIDDPVRTGRIAISGDVEHARRFLGAFEQPSH